MYITNFGNIIVAQVIFKDRLVFDTNLVLPCIIAEIEDISGDVVLKVFHLLIQ